MSGLHSVESGLRQTTQRVSDLQRDIAGGLLTKQSIVTELEVITAELRIAVDALDHRRTTLRNLADQ